MAYVIAEPCMGVKDGACAAVCPIDCIHGGPDDVQLFINPAECIDCDLCASTCPVDAIFPEDDLPAPWRHYAAINASYYE